MKVYFGTKGNKYYVLSTEFSECYIFDNFGSLVSNGGSISSCDNWVEVDFLSFVSTGFGCEVMFDGEKSEVGNTLEDCTKIIRDIGNYVGTMFFINHKDSRGSFTQVFFIFNKGVFSKKVLESKLKVSGWSSLI